MEHVAFVLRIPADQFAEYKKRHENVDPELERRFAEVGIHNYRIFFFDGLLFAYMEVDDFGRAMLELADDPANDRWQRFMSDMLIPWESGETMKVIPNVYRFPREET